MEPEGSLPHSQVPATCYYPEPSRSSPYPPHPTSCRYLANSLAAAMIKPALYRLLTLYVPHLMSLLHCLVCTKDQSRPDAHVPFRNKDNFYGEELLAPRPSPKLEDHPLSAVRDCLFNIFEAALHIGGRSSIRNLRTRHAVVTGTHLSRLGRPQSSEMYSE